MVNGGPGSLLGQTGSPWGLLIVQQGQLLVVPSASLFPISGTRDSLEPLVLVELEPLGRKQRHRRNWMPWGLPELGSVREGLIKGSRGSGGAWWAETTQH